MQGSSQIYLSNALKYYSVAIARLLFFCLGLSCGVASKSYLDKLKRRAACIIDGRSIRADELRSTISWPSLQACRDYLKRALVLVYKCLHRMVPLAVLSGLGTHTKFIVTTLGAMTCCVLLLQKLLSTKEALE